MRLSAWPFLIVLLLVPLLHRWWQKRNKPARVTYPLAIPRSLGTKNPMKLLFVLKYIGLAFVAVALARPQASFRQTERSVSGMDIMIVLDVSASMNIEDLAERARFDIAKETIEGFIKGRGSDRIGLVVFSGEPLTLAPVTLDYGLVLKALRDASIGVLKDGTAIGDGLSLAVGNLRNSNSKGRVIILLTDGDNNVGQIDPATAGELAAGYGIRVYSIAIGREGRVRMPIRQKGVFGNTITTYQWFDNALNPELLQHISNSTNGKFYRVSDADALQKVFDEIDKLEKSEIKSHEKVRYEERYQKPLKIGVLVLLLEQILAKGWWRLIP